MIFALHCSPKPNYHGYQTKDRICKLGSFSNTTPVSTWKYHKERVFTDFCWRTCLSWTEHWHRHDPKPLGSQLQTRLYHPTVLTLQMLLKRELIPADRFLKLAYIPKKMILFVFLRKYFSKNEKEFQFKTSTISVQFPNTSWVLL